MQVHRFLDRNQKGVGYCAHKVTFRDVSPMMFSVWFTEEGVVTDIEGRDKNGRSRKAPVSVWERAHRVFPLVVEVYNQQQKETR